MVEEYRAMKYCNLCSQNDQNSGSTAAYRHQALIACEEAIKSKEQLMNKYSSDFAIHSLSSRQIEMMKVVLKSCVSCNGEGKIKSNLEKIMEQFKNIDAIINLHIRKKF